MRKGWRASNRLAVAEAWRKWKRDNRKDYDKFQHQSRLALLKMQGEKMYGMTFSRRTLRDLDQKLKHDKDEHCQLYKQQKTHHYCDLCAMKCFRNAWAQSDKDGDEEQFLSK